MRPFETSIWRVFFNCLFACLIFSLFKERFWNMWQFVPQQIFYFYTWCTHETNYASINCSCAINFNVYNCTCLLCFHLFNFLFYWWIEPIWKCYTKLFHLFFSNFNSISHIHIPIPFSFAWCNIQQFMLCWLGRKGWINSSAVYCTDLDCLFLFYFALSFCVLNDVFLVCSSSSVLGLQLFRYKSLIHMPISIPPLV